MENSKLITAAREFISLKNRNTHPAGSFDNAGRWYPARHLACCDSIRSPSCSYPMSYMVHCRSAGHVATAHGVDVSDLRSLALRSERECVDPALIASADAEKAAKKTERQAKALAKKIERAMKVGIATAAAATAQPARVRGLGL